MNLNPEIKISEFYSNVVRAVIHLLFFSPLVVWWPIWALGTVIIFLGGGDPEFSPWGQLLIAIFLVGYLPVYVISVIGSWNLHKKQRYGAAIAVSLFPPLVHLWLTFFILFGRLFGWP